MFRKATLFDFVNISFCVVHKYRNFIDTLSNLRLDNHVRLFLTQSLTSTSNNNNLSLLLSAGKSRVPLRSFWTRWTTWWALFRARLANRLWSRERRSLSSTRKSSAQRWRSILRRDSKWFFCWPYFDVIILTFVFDFLFSEPTQFLLVHCIWSIRPIRLWWRWRTSANSRRGRWTSRQNQRDGMKTNWIEDRI